MGVKILSARQYEVINLFAEGYSRKEIAAKLCVSVKTVEAHKYNAMQALNLNTRVELFRWVRETRQQEVCRLREEIEQGLLLLARERVDSNEKLVAWARVVSEMCVDETR